MLVVIDFVVIVFIIAYYCFFYIVTMHTQTHTEQIRCSVSSHSIPIRPNIHRFAFSIACLINFKKMSSLREIIAVAFSALVHNVSYQSHQCRPIQPGLATLAYIKCRRKKTHFMHLFSTLFIIFQCCREHSFLPLLACLVKDTRVTTGTMIDGIQYYKYCANKK